MVKKTAGRSVTEVRLVEAAVQLFSRHGYKGTSTREIANLADVNEATLFRYFARKADLFLAAMESRLNRLKLGRELQQGLASDMDPEIVVPMLVTFMVENLLKQPEMVRLLFVAGFELPNSDKIVREHLGPIFDAVNAYFCRCAARGTICDLEPAIATLGLAGAVSAHHSFLQLFTGSELHADPQQAAPAYAQLWLNALQQRMPLSSATAVTGR